MIEIPKPVPSWTTSDGKVSTSYLGFLKQEITTCLTKTGDNEVGAKKIVDVMDKDPDKLESLIVYLSEMLKQKKNPSLFEVLRKAEPAEQTPPARDEIVIPNSDLIVDDADIGKARVEEQRTSVDQTFGYIDPNSDMGQAA